MNQKNYIFYEGYSYKFKGKQPYCKPNDIVEVEELNNLNPESYGAKIAQGYMLLDFDDKKSGESAIAIIKSENISCHIIETDRGYHFIFKNPEVKMTNSSDMPLACGLYADMKSNTNGRTYWECLQANGKPRRVVVECEKPDILPDFFYELNRLKKQIPNWSEIDEGSRNETLFSYCGLLARAGFSQTSGKKTVQILNQFVLTDPLPDTEIETITRPEAFEYKGSPKKAKKETPKFDEIAKELVEKHKLVYYDSNIYAYTKDHYSMCSDRDLEKMIFNHNNKLIKAHRSEIQAFMELIPEETKHESRDYIWFNNGVYNLNTHELEAHNTELILNQIPHNYNPQADTSALNNALMSWMENDKTKVITLKEICGYCICAGTAEMQQFFILTGTGANGKSTYLDLVTETIGKSNISNLDMNDFYTTFRLSLMQGKLANICNDIADGHIAGQAAAYIKQLSASDAMIVERKFKDPNNGWRNKAVLLFSANTIPTFSDPTGAVARRAVIIPFNADFSFSANKNIKKELITEENIEAFIVEAIKAFEKARERGEFTTTQDMRESKEEFQKTNDSVLQFCEDKEDKYFDMASTAAVYEEYCTFCHTDGLMSLSKNKFSRQLKIHFGIETKTRTLNGITERVYCYAD